MTFDRCKQLNLRMNSRCINEFYPFLQEGVTISAQVGCTLADLLGEQLALDREYVAARITTIFMDNRPVDDINVAVVHDGAKIALSGAMPGLVGATMRSGGFYAALRGGISYVTDASDDINRSGTIHIKLFNLLLPELGPVILERGVFLPASPLDAYFKSRTDTFWNGCVGILLDDIPVDPTKLAAGENFGNAEMINVSVAFRE